MSADTVDLAEDEFVVGRIAGMKRMGNVRYFLIEWDGYGLEDNTWESQDNVHSKGTIDAFVAAYKKEAKLAKGAHVLQLKQKILLRNTYDPETKAYFPKKGQVAKKTTGGKAKVPPALLDSATIAAALVATTAQQSKSEVLTEVIATTNNRKYTSNTVKLHTNIIASSTKPKITPQKRGIENETESVSVSQKSVKEARLEMRKLSLDVFQTFERKMEAIRKTVELKYPIVRMANHQMLNGRAVYEIRNLKSKVTVVNEVDSDLPNNFVYIDDLKYIHPVQPPDPAFLPGCACEKGNHQDCGQGCHDVVAYDNYGRLLINQGTAIYECNSNCHCDMTCKNRVVQRGRKIPLQVYKTKSKGWGVRSTQFIHKGTFIEEYIGEVIQVDEGDSRGQVYDELGCTYLFDMDFAQNELPTKYVIDSYTLGNVSRFFNHSCSPNLEVYAVFYDSADNQMHRLAFFAKRDIQKDEELCFDYNGRNDVSNMENVDESARYSCHCGSDECRRWIYH